MTAEDVAVEPELDLAKTFEELSATMSQIATATLTFSMFAADAMGAFDEFLAEFVLPRRRKVRPLPKRLRQRVERSRTAYAKHQRAERRALQRASIGLKGERP